MSEKILSGRKNGMVMLLLFAALYLGSAEKAENISNSFEHQ